MIGISILFLRSRTATEIYAYSREAVISDTHTVGRCHPEHERARDGAVSGSIKSIQLGGLLS